MYDLEQEKIRGFLKRTGAKRTAIQLPDGLRDYLGDIIPIYEKTGTEPVLLADSCYGACDLADGRAKRMGCDVLVHYGHADMGLTSSIPILYVEVRAMQDPVPTLEDALPNLEGMRLGLATTVQHIGWLRNIKNRLKENEIEPVVGSPGKRVKYPGQVLGCGWNCVTSIVNKVDSFLYIGTGSFHPLGIALATNKEVIVVNPNAKGHEVLSPDMDKFLNQRKAMLSRSAACESVGVLAGTKRGQQRLSLAEEIASLFRGSGYRARIFLVDDLDPGKLADFRMGFYVCAACPGIPLSDADLYDAPILTPFEARVLLGDADWEPYRLDEF